MSRTVWFTIYAILFVASSASTLAAGPVATDISVEELSFLRRNSSNGLTTLEDRREAFEMFMSKMPVETHSHFEADEIGGVPGLWARSGAQKNSANAIVYFHGGGFYSGSSVTHRNVAAALAAQAGADVFVLDYRLAPKHMYPAQLNDAERVYDALRKRGYRSCAMALASDSAGGFLATDLTVRLKRRGEPLPSALFLMSPVFDFSGSSTSMQTKALTDPVISPAGIRSTSVAAFGRAASSVRAQVWSEDLTGFPPTLIQVGTDEALLDDALYFAQREARAGVAARLETYQGVLHQWQLFPTSFAPARTAAAEGGRFLKNNFCQ